MSDQQKGRELERKREREESVNTSRKLAAPLYSPIIGELAEPKMLNVTLGEQTEMKAFASVAHALY